MLFTIAGGKDLTMHEVNEAAEVITSSVAANAKVIFGTIYDDKLKKGEIKVTVIASGFTEMPGARKSLFGSEVSAGRDEKKGKIYNTFLGGNSPASLPTVAKSEEKKTEPAKIEEDDDWGAVPAFLRRKK